MATVAAHSEDAELQRAILRAYAVQAIATFADEGGWLGGWVAECVPRWGRQPWLALLACSLLLPLASGPGGWQKRAEALQH